MKQPKEIAEKLINDMYAEMKWFSRGCAKNCAIICCDEIIKALNIPEWDGDPENSPKYLGDGLYWQAVKKELIK